jgi:ABC-type transport system involved in multi-copper enzyme maturation permease subunit
MKVYSIAINTFREAIRNRVLYLLLIFALLMIGSSRILSMLTVGDESKIIKDLGLSAISIFGVLLSVFIGVGLLSREIERRTIYNILSKPIYRHQFLLGKYLGLLLTILITIGIMAAEFLVLVYLKTGSWELSLIWGVVLIFFELVIITAFAVLFSSFTTPILSSVFTLSIFAVGHLSKNFLLLRERVTTQIGKTLFSFFYYLLPNLENLNIKTQLVHHLPITPELIPFAIAYSMTYAAIVLFLANLIFQRRSFV